MSRDGPDVSERRFRALCLCDRLQVNCAKFAQLPSLRLPLKPNGPLVLHAHCWMAYEREPSLVLHMNCMCFRADYSFSRGISFSVSRLQLSAEACSRPDSEAQAGGQVQPQAVAGPP